MDERRLLSQPHLTVVSGEPDGELRRIEQIITHSVNIAGSEALEQWFEHLLEEAGGTVEVTPKTLDLIGHTRSVAAVLSLGEWLIDVANLTTMTVFRGLAKRAVLPRLGIHALRLLGCNTAGTPQGRATICTLSDLLGIEVYGTNQLLYAAHYGAGGFLDCWSFLLVGSSDLRRERYVGGATWAGSP